MLVSLYNTVKYQELFTHKIADLKVNLKNFSSQYTLNETDALVFYGTSDDVYTYNLYNSIYHFAPPRIKNF